MQVKARCRLVVVAMFMASCSAMTPPPLFNVSQVITLNFEEALLGTLPKGLRSDRGRWAVADSPSAVSGTQLIVHKGDRNSSLSIEAISRVRSIGAEVFLRVMLGSGGAGIACESGNGGHVAIKAEPEKLRISLYAGDELLDSHPLRIRKEEWLRLGLRCGLDGVTGFFDGEPVVSSRQAIAEITLALVVDSDVTAQFDDLRFAADSGAASDLSVPERSQTSSSGSST